MNERPQSLDPELLIGPVKPPGTRETRLMGIAALTGAAASKGTSSGLGNDTDFALLNALRIWSDAVLVGAETARKENYFGVRTTAQQREARRGRGQAEVPPIVVVTKSLKFDTATQLFTDTRTPPLFAVPASVLGDTEVSERAREIEQAGGVIVPVEGEDVSAVVAALHARGFARIVCEGGPSLNTQLIGASEVDVFHYTVSPRAVQPSELRLFGEADTPSDHAFILEAAHATSDSVLFLRYRSVREG
ncbi:pyrimidine reductase family protein [Corynebacterium haemomassiliense]|uniref:Pyrimidine reductase family protein n=2 Tax=Corynebacterium haemomassiliense TaxID=2754726 RepID=A0A7W2E9Z0_9CORY|nr:pyrimidine reductase family protein [Corynebacterium haemomassiliense]MBA5243855.1 pyrimidine reductase family protein [Corynebacterium haemomassiliense]